MEEVTNLQVPSLRFLNNPLDLILIPVIAHHLHIAGHSSVLAEGFILGNLPSLELNGADLGERLRKVRYILGLERRSVLHEVHGVHIEEVTGEVTKDEVDIPRRIVEHHPFPQPVGHTEDSVVQLHVVLPIYSLCHPWISVEVDQYLPSCLLHPDGMLLLLPFLDGYT